MTRSRRSKVRNLSLFLEFFEVLQLYVTVKVCVPAEAAQKHATYPSFWSTKKSVQSMHTLSTHPGWDVSSLQVIPQHLSVCFSSLLASNLLTFLVLASNLQGVWLAKGTVLVINKCFALMNSACIVYIISLWKFKCRPFNPLSVSHFAQLQEYEGYDEYMYLIWTPLGPTQN